MKRKGVFEQAQTAQIQIHPAHAQSHSDLLICFITSYDSGSGQRRPNQTVHPCSLIGPLLSAHDGKTRFRLARPINP